LQGKTAVVTGAGRGIGKAVAKALAAAGAQVMLAARTESELKETQSEIPGSKYVVTDVSQPEQVKKLIQETKEIFKKIDILVTCAGVYGPKGLFHEQNLQEWKQAQDINLLGTANCIHEALPEVESIVCVAGAGVPNPLPRVSSYSVSKAAIVQLVTTLAAEYPKVKINAIAPGPVATKLMQEVLDAGPEVVGKEFHEKNSLWMEGKDRVVPPEVAADFIVKLCQERPCTGKYLSAVWDKELQVPDEMFTLKRIDGKNFDKK